jgi:hypothetical protein
MREALGDLQLDAEVVKRSMTVQRGMGTAYANMAAREDGDYNRDELISFTATCFRRAGAHAILSDEISVSHEMFAQAGNHYARLRKPYALMMWTLAGNKVLGNDFLKIVVPFAEDRQNHMPSGLRRQSVYSLLYYSTANEQEQGQFREFQFNPQLVTEELHSMNALPTGVLGIPVIHYIALATALRVRYDAKAILEAVFPFIATYDIAFRTAQSKRLHWRNLRLPFHPAEPDILAIISLTSRVLVELRVRLADMLDDLPISFGSRMVLQSFLRSDSDESHESPNFIG